MAHGKEPERVDVIIKRKPLTKNEEAAKVNISKHINISIQKEKQFNCR